MRGQLRSQLCFIANRFKSPVAQGTGDVRVDVPWVLTRVPTFPPLLTQITESNNHLCGMCIRLCVGRKKGEATSLRNERPTVLRTPSPDAFCFQGADFSRHPSHTCPSPFTYFLPQNSLMKPLPQHTARMRLRREEREEKKMGIPCTKLVLPRPRVSSLVMFSIFKG